MVYHLIVKMIRLKLIPMRFFDNYDTLTVVGGEVFINGEKDSIYSWLGY